MNYTDFADWIYKSGILSDPWIEGEPRFDLNSFIVSQNLYDRLNKCTEEIGELYNEFSEIILERPELLDSYFHLTNFQKKMWLKSSGLWHGISRLDLFELNDGSIQMCEMNSDTPSGEGEAVLLNEYCQKFYSNLNNPNQNFKQAYQNLIKSFLKNNSKTVAIIYPTEFTEDLSMIKIYQNWIEEIELECILSSPFNIKSKNNDIYIFNKKIDLIFRHYKTDWWGERTSSWIDETVPDGHPLSKEINALLNAEEEGNCSIVNPFGAVITQNKFSMSFFYDYFELFTEKSKLTILEYIPETRRAEDFDLNSLIKEDWVLKSVYGCEGDEVIIGVNTKDEIWNLTLENIDKTKWILQRYFDAKKIENKIPNYGLYLISGKPKGIFVRLSNIQTEYNSLTVPVFIDNYIT